jgi:hypothetical protein
MPEQNFSTDVKPPAKRVGVERRAWVRYSLRKLTLCHAIAAQPYDRWWRATVHDVSISGIGLSCSSQIPPGTLLAIELEGVPRLMLARVVHAGLRAEDTWMLGCEFLQILSDEELDAIV